MLDWSLAFGLKTSKSAAGLGQANPRIVAMFYINSYLRGEDSR